MPRTTRRRKLAAGGELNFAADAYRKANKIAGGKCIACLDAATDLDLRCKDYKTAAKDAAAMLALAVTPTDKSISEKLRAQALYLQAGDKPKAKQLQNIHTLLQTALVDSPKNVSARFLDGTVLARMGQMDAARKQFQTCVDQCSVTDPYLARAKHFAANPALSYARMAPAFTVTALDGSKFTLDEMGGRVVLIDFGRPGAAPAMRNCRTFRRLPKSLPTSH